MSNLDSNDSFEHLMLNDSTTKDENPKVAMCVQFLEASPQIPPSLAKVEPLKVQEKPSSDEEQALEVKLKPLPSSMRYEFLALNFTYPVILNASLSASQVDSLLRVLREQRKAIIYTLDNIEGIHPSVCMH